MYRDGQPEHILLDREAELILWGQDWRTPCRRIPFCFKRDRMPFLELALDFSHLGPRRQIPDLIQSLGLPLNIKSPPRCSHYSNSGVSHLLFPCLSAVTSLTGHLLPCFHPLTPGSGFAFLAQHWLLPLASLLLHDTTWPHLIIYGIPSHPPVHLLIKWS